MHFVVDASIAACWLMPDERHPIALAALAKLANESAIAPSLWWFEIRNVLIVNERRGRIDGAQTRMALLRLEAMQIGLDTTVDEDRILHLARTHRLTIYDAAYLALAQRSACPLATLDQAMANAAQAEGIALIGEP